MGPISTVAGQNGSQQVIEAYNAGSGTLNLAVSSTASWLTVAVGQSQACTTRTGTCLPINIALQTAALPAGPVTGFIDVTDPNADDAPQSIVVMVEVGGAVPDQVNLFVAPTSGASDSVSFSTNSQLSFNTATNNGGQWLSMAFEGSGSFNFVMPYRIRGRYLTGMGEGVYTGNVNVTASSFAPDIGNVPVTMTVTSAPIGTLSSTSLSTRLAQNSLTLERQVSLTNRGLGSIAISGVAAATGSGGDWLTAEQIGTYNSVRVTFDATGVAPGQYQGTVTVNSNAVNSPHVVQATLIVEAQGPPKASFEGVVNNATFLAESVSPGDIVALFGEQLSYEPPTEGGVLPLPKELGSASVYVNGQAAPLFYTSYGQINFQIPYEITSGDVRVQPMRDGQAGNVVTVNVAPRAPRILSFLGNYAIAVNQDGTFPIPETAGIASRPANAGDVLTMYAIGFGQTTPTAPTGEGAPSDPLAWVAPLPTVYFGGGILRVSATPLFVGLTPGFVGLYQINIQIPANAPIGDNVPLIVEASGTVSNQVEVAIE